MVPVSNCTHSPTCICRAPQTELAKRRAESAHLFFKKDRSQQAFTSAPVLLTRQTRIVNREFFRHWSSFAGQFPHTRIIRRKIRRSPGNRGLGQVDVQRGQPLLETLVVDGTVPSDSGDGYWDTWDSANNRWIENGVTCPRWAANTWHHVQWYVERVGPTQYRYDTLVVDGWR
jgi:hypothetical protein